MTLWQYLKSRTVWGSLLLSASRLPIVPDTYKPLLEAAGVALMGVGVRGALASAGSAQDGAK